MSPLKTSAPNNRDCSGPERRCGREVQSAAGATADAGIPDELSRRSLLKLIGASIAGASLSSCMRGPNERILPYSRAWPEATPGKLFHYATVLSRGGWATGLLITRYDGRPIKIEGNPDHPTSLGATSAMDQAELLELYDPARKRSVERRGAAASFRKLLRFLLDQAGAQKGDGGAGLRLLLEPSPSPLRAELVERILAAFPRARAVSYCAAAPPFAAEGARLAMGALAQPVYDLSKADVIVSLDSDLLAQGPDALRHARAFAARRAPPDMNRLYAAEPSLSPTGSLADHRLRLKASEVGALALAIAGELSRLPQGRALAPLQPTSAAVQLKPEAQRFAKAVAADLAAHPRASLVAAGEGQPKEVHALALAVNEALGNRGNSVRLFPGPSAAIEAGPAALSGLVEEMRAGAVQLLLVTAFNPVYASPGDLDFAGALAKVPHSVYLGAYQDETAARCEWSVPKAHALETWGDARTPDGMTSLAQPLIAPLWGGVAESELLSALLGEGQLGAHRLLLESWARRGGPTGPAFEKWLADGVLPQTQPPSTAPVDYAAVARAVRALPLAAPPGLELHLFADRNLFDGRYGNNAWLLELPEPATKLAWDNAALVSPATARELSVTTGDIIHLRAPSGAVDVPVLVAPGQADGCLSLALGWGQEGPGLAVGRTVGVNAYRLQRWEHPSFESGLEVVRALRSTPLAVVQGSFSLEDRPIAFALDVRELPKRTDELSARRGPLPALYRPFDDGVGHAWAMTIDLSRCTSCSACMVACQAENNSPAVGKEMVLRGRAMHWLQIDRYFLGPIENPQTLNAPMACVHCEYAPCEYVCPVNATVHSDEGLNEMIYNRCVGTRYCSNNCPYKVRRFNFFNYNRDLSPAEALAKNPDVTVRARGVMEKCTYCVQRIERARIESRISGKPITDGQILTACQQACPTEAIVFGDLNDPASKVARFKRDPRRFDVLHEVGTRPRTSHLARMTNMNPEVEAPRSGNPAGRRP
jgi:Fe-S-cluster-containing dehydrogenase component